MAKPRKAAAAVVGQRQLFPEALQHQRQLTMTVLVPAETARVVAAEQARRDRAAVKNPRGWRVIEETGGLHGRRWVFAKKADAMRQARAIAKTAAPGNGAYVVDTYGKRSTFVVAKAKARNPRRKRTLVATVQRKKMATRAELMKRALYYQERAEHADNVGDRVNARAYQAQAERVIEQINRIRPLAPASAKKNTHKACACANPKKKRARTTVKRSTTKTTVRTTANPVARIELSRAESSRWLQHGSYRLQIMQKGKALAKRHRGSVQIIDAHGKVRSTLRP